MPLIKQLCYFWDVLIVQISNLIPHKDVVGYTTGDCRYVSSDYGRARDSKDLEDSALLESSFLGFVRAGWGFLCEARTRLRSVAGM